VQVPIKDSQEQSQPLTVQFPPIATSTSLVVAP
jgi:hypothetical protein